jgi:lipopolysaccharide export system permease protein
MKKKIFRIISLDCFGFFLLCLLSVSAIIWILQAVNYLDFVTEDGHGFLVYLKYTLLSFPKIISRILPFAIFFSISYVLLKYENNNELVIFWNFGVSKINFINFFIKLSFIFVFLGLLLNSLIVPSTLDKSRSYIKSSNLDFFENMLKPKKFIDVIKNLTIFFDEKKLNGDLKNIFLKDNSKEGGYQVTFAKIGKFEQRENNKVLVLYDGKTLTKQNKSISEFKFDKTDFNLANYETKTTSQTKTQENSTKQLLECILKLNDLKSIKKNTIIIDNFFNCRINNLENIYEELYKRLIIPFYNILLISISLLLILKSKEDKEFNLYKYKVFIFGLLFIIFLEVSSNFIRPSLDENIIIFILPVILYIAMYIYFLKKLNFKKT